MKDTSSEMNCPRCGQKVATQVVHCEHCGINLILAAVIIAEQDLNKPELTKLFTSQESGSLSPEILVPRLGEILREKGLLRLKDLERALRIHADLAAAGQPRRLGQVLLELALIDRDTLDRVITEQILQLQGALHLANRHLEQRVQERTVDLQRALGKLAELNQLKSNFISGISHELRTPLTHIKGYLDLLSDGSLGPITEEQEIALEVLGKAESRLEGLIEDLLRFSLAVRGEFTLHLEATPVGNLIASASERGMKLAKAKDIRFETEVEDDLPVLTVDPEKISWAIMQLIDNAVKYTKPGGFVKINASAGDSGVTVCVADNGIGIPADRIEEIFEPFHQLDGSDTRHFGGMGLGLALVRRILEAHGSLIKVQSEVGQGSCFQFTLPSGK